MPDARHSKQSPSIGGVHVLQAYDYADAPARTGATGFVSTDIGKVARQLDNNTFWVLTATTPTWSQINSGGGSDATGEWLFGNGNVFATTTTRYLTPGGTDGPATIALIQIRMPRAGTLQKLYVQQTPNGGNANTIVYTVRKGGVATTLTCSIAANATNGSDLTHTVVVVAGDLIDIEVTKAASVGASPQNVEATLEFAA